jgi:hypothetical protein
MGSFGTTEIILIFGLLMVVVLPVVLIVSLLNRSSKKQLAGLRKCPFCAGTIQREAIVCRFCNRDLAGGA